jgi:hypothetical protein
MTKCLLLFYLLSGRVQQVDDLYSVHANNTIYEFACEGEVLRWIETGTFSYDDNLCKCGELK